jgi:hypothetical protein
MNTLLVKPEDYEKDLQKQAIDVGRNALLEDFMDLYEKVQNATSENPCDITDERELQELEYMLNYLEQLSPSNVPF